MEVPIFSPHGYTGYAKKVFGEDCYVYGPTTEHCEILLSNVDEDVSLHIDAGMPTTVYANDVALMDSCMMTPVLISSSGFVTIRRVQATGGKGAASSRGSGVLPPVTPRGGSGNYGEISFLSTAISPMKVVSPPAAAPSLPLGVLAPMTPVITCRVSTKCWPRVFPHGDNSTDAQLMQYFKEAVVVPVKTMRLLGVEEGSMVQVEFHSEESVLAASKVVFALTSDFVGEEFSFDSCMRHFIAPFFLQRCRVISVGEEFEFKNHDYGQLHVKVVAIEDGLLKCGLVVESTCIRLLAQPEAPPKLQGHGSGRVSESSTPRMRVPSARKSSGSVRGSSLPRNSHPRMSEASPRPKLPPGARSSTSGKPFPIVGGPPRVHEPSPRRASRDVEPHGGIASLSAYSPQAFDASPTLITDQMHSPTSFTALKVASADRAPDDGATAAIIVATTVTAVSAPADVSKDAVVNPAARTSPSSEVQDGDGVNIPPVPSPQHRDTLPTNEHAPDAINPSNFATESPTEHSASFLKKPQETESVLLPQSSVDFLAVVPQEDLQDTRFETYSSRKSDTNSVHNMASAASSPTGSSWSQREVHSAISTTEQRIVACSGKSSVATQHDAGSVEFRSVEVQTDRESPEKVIVCDNLLGDTKGALQEPTEAAPRQEEEEEEEEGGPKNVLGLSSIHLPHTVSNITLSSTRPAFEKYGMGANSEERNEEVHLLEAEEEGVSSKDTAAELTADDFNEALKGKSQESAWSVPNQEEEGKEPKNDLNSNDALKILTHHSDTAEAAETQLEQPLTVTTDVAFRAGRIVEKWLDVKAKWQGLSISDLLKRESCAVIKEFQHFLAVYKELKQRHADYLAYLDSPYGHTVRGDLVLRISLLAASNMEGDGGGAIKPPWRPAESHGESIETPSEKANDDFKSKKNMCDANSKSCATALATELLKLSVREVTAKLGCGVLHIFRVGGTCPALYCTLMKPYADGPGEITLMGESFPVEVLQTTILEDLCEAREESRHDWVQLSTLWKEAISGVLQKGVFTKHMQKVRQLFFDLAFLLQCPGEIRLSVGCQRHVDPFPPNSAECVVQTEKTGGDFNVTGASNRTPSTTGSAERKAALSNLRKEFLPYLQELQDTYYLYFELLEPFLLNSMRQLDTVSTLTDAMKCKELVEFLKVSHEAQMAEQRAEETGTHLPLTILEEERAAFLKLVEARKAGEIMPLPLEWWEAENLSSKNKFP
ncbi:hypothetical protein MOQ_007725 [Trypanosoma cruzi marinkellei]|uniref:Uncharacterized protein n=1 Tax=Trypanosoma cruzi marinkellei TaxID=85056 RepID=K2MS96_TRYCR|nr:hypothetical protein MOQ_007725 [Trypanosoma cruzi marinkellei]